MVGRGAHPGGGLDRQQNDHGKGATTCCFETFVKEEGRRDSFLYSKSIPHWVVSLKTVASERYGRLLALPARLSMSIAVPAILVASTKLGDR